MIKKDLLSGQAVLLVVLTLAVVLTLVLSVISRTITDVKITTVEGDSLRAFSAAEAGIERHLTSYSYTFSDFTLNNVEVTGSISPKYENQREMNYPEKLVEAEAATVWFVDHDDNGNISCGAGTTCYSGTPANARMRLCWGEDGAPLYPAVEISVYYDPDYDLDFSDVEVARYNVDPNAATRATNNFRPNDPGGCNNVAGEGVDYSRRTFNINFNNSGLDYFGIPNAVIQNRMGLLFARIRFFYNGSEAVPFGVILSNSGAGSFFPSQARVIESSGKLGDAQRRVEITALYPDLPPIFDYSLFSATGGISQ
ncbi:MAG: hypothetical protein ACD_52C00004G0007 [uncultured bacterium]|uniref:Type 4 fimbrial biogenesis protein PilX N-terminal domain-containing protein n=1 Tax=Candidatus Woesebacteria bacterium RIFCSPHIGHO2_12_FULL_41_24 TaxID=1802510 RepID=A0A1F8ASN0_9BACT|nr:MAG: hypothetical protein ACD_52C00004G0007 [uncultured bacterium]OGM13369.1 MAG: hypothetical protein A2W15_05720 [Candidatus Woesebacteria bacterium RBG_16_41_13]OGM30943.1 MAG: hypothetical protein A2873_04035 [Candidatus Woesebacteria bacterium RIFCSPHIGHO2_01_FULL_42_80]OGM35912.1 MAG: hypothetical protein A3D84_01505 [Candidatus Woesebacteria bacterium RIFCSPHIGHO2_02_FULL_42_20]OGM54195.1 MAG: hypothetical protein A3E44_00750 [Candidatus Woesebacteria bacterium RIFCSPHIGHO2_12_FULL_41